jgi:hypothetical protein
LFAAQYKITLPADYDMNIIRDRVKNNGHKTDGFLDLRYKLYLITEKEVMGNIQNSYCPLYVWKSHEGFNEFLFNGFYDNILRSFGWQRVEIGVPLFDTTTVKIAEAAFCFHLTGVIPPQESLTHLREQILEDVHRLDGSEYLVIYSPENWRYDVYFFLNDLNKIDGLKGTTYTILHVSQ